MSVLRLSKLFSKTPGADPYKQNAKAKQRKEIRIKHIEPGSLEQDTARDRSKMSYRI